MNHRETNGRTPWWRTRGGIAFIGFVAIAGFFLFTEHRAHMVGALPLVLLALCPLLHLFGHGGHDHGGELPTTPGKEEVGGVGNKPPKGGRP